jgi:hypothetical protein
MFIDQRHLLRSNAAQLHYGVAVTDVDGDNAFELFVTGFGCRNLVLKWDGSGFVDIADDTLADGMRRAIGVAAGDIDRDGREEIYVLNTDTFMGRKRFGDRLFAIRSSNRIDLCALPQNQPALNLTAGRSVACIDREGTGRYGFVVANYGGPLRLYELDTIGHLRDMASVAQVNRTTGGRGIITLPLVSEYMDIFMANEHGANFLFRNRGNGTFEEIATTSGLSDPDEHGRGVAALDFNNDGRFDLVYGNWQGTHRLMRQTEDRTFVDITPPAMAEPSQVRTVLAADFDNDGCEEIFFNNIGQPNRLFGWRNGVWVPLDIGDALEPGGMGTGAAVGDFDGDGRLELLIAHGELEAQPLSLYRADTGNNNWLRVLPLTLYGAPARGAVVMLQCAGRRQRRVIDAGSGYLCQMEPVAHFGLGTATQVERVVVRWPDGAMSLIDRPERNTMLRVPYPAY